MTRAEYVAAIHAECDRLAESKRMAAIEANQAAQLRQQQQRRRRRSDRRDAVVRAYDRLRERGIIAPARRLPGARPAADLGLPDWLSAGFETARGERRRLSPEELSLAWLAAEESLAGPAAAIVYARRTARRESQGVYGRGGRRRTVDSTGRAVEEQRRHDRGVDAFAAADGGQVLDWIVRGRESTPDAQDALGAAAARVAAVRAAIGSRACDLIVAGHTQDELSGMLGLSVRAVQRLYSLARAAAGVKAARAREACESVPALV